MTTDPDQLTLILHHRWNYGLQPLRRLYLPHNSHQRSCMESRRRTIHLLLGGWRVGSGVQPSRKFILQFHQLEPPRAATEHGQLNETSTSILQSAVPQCCQPSVTMATDWTYVSGKQLLRMKEKEHERAEVRATRPGSTLPFAHLTAEISSSTTVTVQTQQSHVTTTAGNIVDFCLYLQHLVCFSAVCWFGLCSLTSC